MGKRSRKRAGSGESVVDRPRPVVPATGAPAPHARHVDRRARLADAPPAPWSPFPLIEFCILIGIILIVVGFLGGGSRRETLLIFGFALVGLSSLELSIREHFAGFRSHTLLLAAAGALIVCVPFGIITGLSRAVMLVIGTVLFALAAFVLRSTFARRSGGLGFRA